MATTKTQKRVALVLQRLAEMAAQSNDDAKIISYALEDMLLGITQDDGFGTEGQCDPRGDGREGQWSMSRVQGIDG